MKPKVKLRLFQILVGLLLLIIVNQLLWMKRTNESILYYETLQKTFSMESDDEIQLGGKLDEKANLLYEFKPNDQLNLINENADYVGWVAIENTGINHPVVRAKDNAFYLNRDFNKKPSKAGAIFMDYRNLGQFNDRHTVIYGHYMNDGSMFGDLHAFKSESFFKQNRQIRLKGLYEEKTYTIFSVTIENADEYEIDIRVLDDDYLKTLMDASLHELNFNLDLSKNILTLVTCSYEMENGRIIIHAFEDE